MKRIETRQLRSCRSPMALGGYFNSIYRAHRTLLVRAILSLLLFATAGVTSVANAAQIVVVYSSTRPAYAKVGEAFKQRIRGHETTVVGVDKIPSPPPPSKTSTIANIQADAVIAIGFEAASRLSLVLPDHIPLVSCVVSATDHINLWDRRMNFGVCYEPTLNTQIQLMRDSRRTFRSVGMIYVEPTSEPAKSHSHRVKEAFETALDRIDIDLIAIKAPSVDQTSMSVRRLISERPSFVVTFRDPIYGSQTFKTILASSIHSRVPVYGFTERLVKSGCIVGVENQFSTSAHVDQCIRLLTDAISDNPPAPPLPNSIEDPRWQEPDHQVYFNAKLAEFWQLIVPRAIRGRAKLIE